MVELKLICSILYQIRLEMRNPAMQEGKDFEKGSTVYLANVKRWIDTNGSVVLTVRRSDLKEIHPVP